MGQHPSFQPRPAQPQPAAPTGQHPSFQPRPAAPAMPAAPQHPSFQPRPGGGAPQQQAAPSALPQRSTAAYPVTQRPDGVTRDLRHPAPASAPAPVRAPAPAPVRRAEPEWLRPAGERRITGDARIPVDPSDNSLLPERRAEVARLSERATGRDLVRRPATETSVLPATAAGYGGDDGGDYDDFPPFDRGGRHRGPRRPAFRAAVPIVAVLAAGGGALGLVHAVSSGAPGSQAMDMASGNNGSAITTDLSNAPTAADGAGSGFSTAGTDSRTSPLDATASTAAGGYSATSPGQHTTTPGGHTTVPGAPGTTATSAAAGPGTPDASGSGLPTNQPIQASSSTGAPSTPQNSTSAPSTPGTPTSTQTPPTSTPTTPPSQVPTQPSTPPTTPTSGQTPPSSSPSTPSTPPTTPSASGTTPQLPTTGTLQAGDTGAEVSTLQTLLDRIGSSTWVPVTGVYDTRTADAVAYVQNMQHITADPAGVCGPTTAAAINALAAAQ
jgi:hypothetical protein